MGFQNFLQNLKILIGSRVMDLSILGKLAFYKEVANCTEIEKRY